MVLIRNVHSLFTKMYILEWETTFNSFNSISLISIFFFFFFRAKIICFNQLICTNLNLLLLVSLIDSLVRGRAVFR